MTVDYRIRNIIIAAALAAAAVLLTIIYITSARDDDAASKQDVTVYTAGKDYSVGTAGASIADSMKKTTVKRDALVSGAVTKPSQIAGLYLVQPAVKGEQLTLERFALPAEQGVRAKLAGKQRAMQVSGTADQVLKGVLVAGDRVDVLVNLKNGDAVSEQNKVSTVLRNIRVLDTSETSDSEVQATSDQVGAVVLGMTDEQTQAMYFVQENGTWSLTLRPVKKPKDSSQTVVTQSNVLSAGAK